ncbi:hypothetical protein KGM_203855 [Danaus plexippus plexippus]|uniref:Uncharacterized protein n=1 Tax=Danaus plexippus plexippus TaxID=278856 RepID=A0A212EIQ8_DANPL|nr:hypothetical protein KGM_203855 [Danaus plexippus plexippus]
MLLTAANYLDPLMAREQDLRIWCLGRAGSYNTPYRYRVFRVWRVRPRSANPEHQHGIRGEHSPRHDVALVLSHDQIYIYYIFPHRFMYAYRSTLTGPRETLVEEMFFAGSGYEYLEHVYENYKIFYQRVKRSHVVDCSIYLPKWWGKFICIKNLRSLPGIQNGGGLFSNDHLVGLGCFEIRYNEDRLFVFTDLRYYVRWIYKYAQIEPGQYYEYAYAQWSIALGIFYDGNGNYPYIPAWQVRGDLFPLG